MFRQFDNIFWMFWPHTLSRPGYCIRRSPSAEVLLIMKHRRAVTYSVSQKSTVFLCFHSTHKKRRLWIPWEMTSSKALVSVKYEMYQSYCFSIRLLDIHIQATTYRAKLLDEVVIRDYTQNVNLQQALSSGTFFANLKIGFSGKLLNIHLLGCFKTTFKTRRYFHVKSSKFHYREGIFQITDSILSMVISTNHIKM